MKKEYDYLLVGAGLFNAVFAQQAKMHGKRCLVIDKRPHLGGNIYSEESYGITIHKYGSHIFHISQPFLKGKLIARIEAFDLFHQLSSTQYEVNAQGRTETWYRSLPHYVMAHLVYHWNKNPKKK